MNRALLWGVAVLLMLKVVALANLYLRIWGMVLRRPRWRVAADPEVPPWLLDFAAPGVARLKALGFEPRGALASVGFDRQLDDEGHDLLFEHPASGTWAFVYVQPAVPAGRPLFIDFVTWFDDGRVRMTLSTAPGVADRALPDAVLESMPHLSLGRRFVHHCFQLERSPGAGAERAPVKAMTAHGVAADLTRRHGEVSEEACRRGEVVDHGDGTLGYTRMGALRVTRSVLGGLGERPSHAGEFHGAYGPDRVGEPPPAPHQARIHAELAHLTRRRTCRSASVWIFVGTLVLFFATLVGHIAPLMLAMLVGVLLAHEMGHFVAMRAFGYRETAVYFLPLVGAAASGTKPEATLSERAVVFLAGPVPGLAAGLVMMNTLPRGDQLGWWTPLTLMLVYVNLFNLLPVLPLDGGRLVERVLLTPFPRGEVAFKVLSALLFGGLGAWSGEYALVLIGAFVAVSLPASLRTALAMQALGFEAAERPGAPREPAPDREALYARLDAAGYADMRFVRKYRIVSELEKRLQAPRAAPWARLGWFASYLTLLGGSLWAARALLHR